MKAAIPKPSNGNKINWVNDPTTIALGFANILLKSAGVRDKPNPSMIMAKANGKNTVDTMFDSI
ncbi:hypothetical protein MYP_2770 [Sporocytophaga myxococcoides]|uniref:Uncharacterized protein n=1 Tax=Sporocytophaga myxococcoides TaxID=153721 RepID=A0A098LGH6_9BACT|nr:hypothetical protein MYP_2770 [Sporocytophaga myxococcoides]